MLSYRVWLLLIFLLIVLGIRFWIFELGLRQRPASGKVTLQARLAEEPVLEKGRQSFNLVVNGERFGIVTYSDVLLDYGDKILIKGEFAKKGSKYFVDNANVQRIANDKNLLSKIDIYVKETVNNVLYNYLSNDSSALLAGIIFGGRQGLSSDLMKNLRITGVLHVIAASGMNVAFVASAIMSLFGRFVRRQIVIVLAMIGVVFYAFLAGFELSIVRAAIMLVVALAASLLGKGYLPFKALLITGYLMLIYNPGNLLDIGFQLSFLSTLGIMLIKPILFRDKFLLLDDIGTTIAAQIATLPILILNFGEYGLLSVVVNGIVLWTVPYLMLFGILGIVLGAVFLPLGAMFIWMCLPLLIYFQAVVGYFGGLDWLWRAQGFSWFFGIGYYFMVLGLIVYFRGRFMKQERVNGNSEKYLGF